MNVKLQGRQQGVNKMDIIRYGCGYKYQLAEDYHLKVSITPDNDVPADERIKAFLELKKEGTLIIRAGYAWDGPSGPTRDTPSFMRGSLVHDALYQLMREKAIDKKWRNEADKELKRICREDGMSLIYSNWVYWAVKKFGGMAADPASRKKVVTAPQRSE
jgi:hypothetical protein